MPKIRPRGECRSCHRDLSLTADETVTAHGAAAARCPGSHRPPVGEPPCTMSCGRTAGSVSYPADLIGTPNLMEIAHASTHVCFDPEHQPEAAEWVNQKTGHPGVFVPFKAVARV